MDIIELNFVDSTNNYAKKTVSDNKIIENIIIYTHSQSEGRGCGTNSWYSEDDKSLLFSIVFFLNIEVDKHFYISMLASLGICDYVENKGINAKIKWPNDIYINNKKLCGILIENSIQGSFIKNTIIGIGINLNQITFPDFLENAISISNITGKVYDIKEEIENVSKIVMNKLLNFDNYSFEILREQYLSKLYRFNSFNDYKLRNDTIVKLKIVDIEPDGHIAMKNKSGKMFKFYFKEIEYI